MAFARVLVIDKRPGRDRAMGFKHRHQKFVGIFKCCWHAEIGVDCADNPDGVHLGGTEIENLDSATLRAAE
uniref:hypothetical protein n=1 Tax=Acidocella sp. C78 TaxID=1671486 RepID=UPI0020C13784|nr:hypothetical protein [Acidocella sp. C78]